MARRSLVVFYTLVVFFIVAFTTLITTIIAMEDNSEEAVPMSITHEQFYVSPPRGHSKPPPKYFFEAVVRHKKQWIGLHYDRTYFQRELEDAERETAIRHMLEAWFAFLDDNDFEAWIAHGTLLGWYWNGEPLPWDVDVDVQMFVRTMQTMSDKFNNTMYEYEISEGKTRKYYININPFFTYRSRSNGQNVIDGRFVDTETGLYIDMTSLAEADPIRHPNIVSCKNNHRYLVDDILPLRSTMFIGKRVYIPYQFEKILQKEYSRRALTNGRYNGYIYSAQDQKWMNEQVFRQLHRPKQDIGKGPRIDPLSRPVPTSNAAGLRAIKVGQATRTSPGAPTAEQIQTSHTTTSPTQPQTEAETEPPKTQGDQDAQPIQQQPLYRVGGGGKASPRRRSPTPT